MTTATGTTPVAPAWHGYTDAADVAWVTNKGWQAPQDAVRSAREAEKLIGRDPSTLLVLPRADDPAGFLQTMDKLGRPADPSKYEFDVPKGQQPNEVFQTWARDAFHKLGLTGEMGKGLTKAYNDFLGQQAALMEADYKTSVATDKQALLNEWKGGHERMMNIAESAAASLGVTGEMMDGIEQAIGYAATMKFFAGLGQKMSEDQLVLPGEKGGKFDNALLTPAEAKAQWEAKKLDPNFMAALNDKKHPAHASTQATQTTLFKIMYPEN